MIISLRAATSFDLPRLVRLPCQLIHCRAASIVHHERIACLNQISRHGLAHDAETDETNNRLTHGFYLQLQYQEQRGVKVVGLNFVLQEFVRGF